MVLRLPQLTEASLAASFLEMIRKMTFSNKDHLLLKISKLLQLCNRLKNSRHRLGQGGKHLRRLNSQIISSSSGNNKINISLSHSLSNNTHLLSPLFQLHMRPSSLVYYHLFLLCRLKLRRMANLQNRHRQVKLMYHLSIFLPSQTLRAASYLLSCRTNLVRYL